MRPPPSDVSTVVWGLGTGRHIPRESAGVLVFAIDYGAHEGERARATIMADPGLRDAVACGRVRVIVAPPGVMAQMFQQVGSAAMEVHLPSLSAAPAAAQPLARVIERIHLEARNNDRFRPLMENNLRKNLSALASAPTLSTLHDAASSSPVFVVAAGPSASAAMEHLFLWQDMGPVVAVDTMVGPLRDAGVRVDVAVTVDPHAASARHFDGDLSHVRALAFQPYACPEAVAAVEQRVLAVPAGDLLWDQLAPHLALDSVAVGDTVTVFALQVAHTMTRSAVVLVGADFAHVDGRTHANGTAHGRAANDSGTTVMNTRGEFIPTTNELLRFRQASMQAIAASGLPHLCVDGGGAIVEGTTMVDAAVADAILHENGALFRGFPWPSAFSEEEATSRAAEVESRWAPLRAAA